MQGLVAAGYPGTSVFPAVSKDIERSGPPSGRGNAVENRGTMWVIYVGILVAVITATVGLLTNVGLVETATLVGIEAILTVTLDTLQTIRTREDTVLGPDARELQPRDIAHAKGFTTGILKARRINNAFLQQRVDDAVEASRRVLTEIASGLVEYDLTPGGVLYTEVDVVASARDRARVTSFVNSPEYWTSPYGSAYLAQNRAAIARGVKITRIFIEDQTYLQALRPIVQTHRDAGIECRVAIRTEVPATCLRDFAILDDGHLAVSLILNDNRMPSAIQFVAGATEIGQAEIRRLEDVYRVLVQRSVSADEFLSDSNRNG